MNTTGFIRDMITKTFTDDEFVKHVAGCVEKELQEWDLHSEVIVLSIPDYIIIVKYCGKTHWIEMAKEYADELQHQGLYNMDRAIWDRLQFEGISIEQRTGNYLDYVYYED